MVLNNAIVQFQLSFRNRTSLALKIVKAERKEERWLISHYWWWSGWSL